MKNIIKDLPKKITDKEKMQNFIEKLSNHECFVLFNDLGQSYAKKLSEELRDEGFLFINGLGYRGGIDFKIFNSLEEARQEQNKRKEEINRAHKKLELEIKMQIYKEIK